MSKSKKATLVGSCDEMKHGRLGSATAGKQTSVITIQEGKPDAAALIAFMTDCLVPLLADRFMNARGG